MLEIRGLRCLFGDVLALEDVSFDVPRGHMVGFVGRNGSGKTTMRVVMGMVRPDHGEVRWDSAAVDQNTRLRFGYMPEERGLYPKMRVRDQLVHFGRLSGLRAADAKASAEQWIDLLGLTDRADDVSAELSLGNQQRVQLGVALVHRPDLLILDEPFSGLDPVGVEVLADVLRKEAARGAGVVFSSHQLELVERLCDDVVIIEAGRIVDAPSQADDDIGLRVEVTVEGGADGWVTSLSGVDVVDRNGDRLVLELRDGTTPTEVLEAAGSAGAVTFFAVGRTTLADRFREATSG